MNYDITILGGGSGGLTAARIAASLGANVLLIDRERLGGDCLYSGCIPSKSLIHVAHLVQQSQDAAQIGLTTQTGVDMVKVAAYIQAVIERIHEEEKVYVEGVTVKFGKISFQSPTTLILNNEKITSHATLIATGSHPAIPNIEGLREIGYLTNEDVFCLTALPASIILVGGGPVGVELGQALARLGSQVTLLQRSARLLPKEDPEVSATIARVLQSEGITLAMNTRFVRVDLCGHKKIITAKQGEDLVTFEADELLLAVGRQPNLEDLNLDAAGIAYDASGIKVNQYLQTSTKNIFAFGDVIGNYLFTHVAAYQAGIAVRNALLPVAKKKVNYRALPWCVFTDPEVARVGLTLAQAKQQHTHTRVVTLPWASIDRAQTESETIGFIKFILAGKKDEIVGAHLVGSHAGELLGEITLAMQHRLTISDILATIHAYPTLSTGIQQTSFEAYLTSTQLRRNRQIIQATLHLRR